MFAALSYTKAQTLFSIFQCYRIYFEFLPILQMYVMQELPPFLVLGCINTNLVDNDMSRLDNYDLIQKCKSLVLKKHAENFLERL